jgi:hypothetical protein
MGVSTGVAVGVAKLPPRLTLVMIFTAFKPGANRFWDAESTFAIVVCAESVTVSHPLIPIDSKNRVRAKYRFTVSYRLNRDRA